MANPNDSKSPSPEHAEPPGSAFELVAAGLGVLLAVAGLFGVSRLDTAAFGMIAAGFALLAQGSTVAARWHRAAHFRERERIERVGIATEVVGGFIVIVLGVVAASNVRPESVLPMSALVLGAAMILAGPTQPALARARGHRWRVTRDAVRSASGVMTMAGVAGLATGLLAFAGGPYATLTLVAVLCATGALIIAAGAVTARIANRLA